MLDIPSLRSGNRAAMLFSCAARVDALEGITHFFSQRHLMIYSTQQFIIEDVLFLRLEWKLDDCWENEEAFSADFTNFSKHFDAQFEVKFLNRKQSMGLFVAANDHCLKAVLNLWQLDCFGLLDVSFIVGDNDAARYYADRHAVPFFEVAGEALQREKKQLEIVHRYSPELIGLTTDVTPLSAQLLNRVSAIVFESRRSFLTNGGYSGSLASLYQQGVKLLGASSRVVTAEVDGGRIIEQGVHRLDEGATLAEFEESIHLIEQNVFCQALAKLLQHKVLINKNRCVVFA